MGRDLLIERECSCGSKKLLRTSKKSKKQYLRIYLVPFPEDHKHKWRKVIVDENKENV